MKKRVLITIFVVNGILLTGCVSDSEYAALESRVSALEAQLSQYEQPTGTTVAKDENVSEDFKAEETNVSEESYSYIIDDLSDQDVIAECEY